MKRYSEVYSYRGKHFRYDYERSILEYIWIVEEDDEELKLHKGDIEVLNGAGLKEENWKNKRLRNMYLSEWILELDEESEYLAEEFLKYEMI